jgi:LPXTG-motif cell wall-anchored protein
MKRLGMILGFILLFFGTMSASAAAAELSLRPGSGEIRRGANFTVDILIDTAGEASNLARAVLTFDPGLVQVLKAEKNESLYCDYPEDEQSVDNNNGVLMLTGFCQSGEDVLYVTEDEPDVFARIQFEAVSNGSLVLDWEYSGEDEPFKSVIAADGSPPQSVLEEKPIAGVYSIVSSITTPPPSTGYTVSIGMIAAGLGLLSLGIVYVRFKDSLTAPKLKGRTVVVYGKED